MPDVALEIIREAAGSPLLGQSALVDASATSGTTTTLVDNVNLVTFANDTQYKGYWLYFWSGGNPGVSRFVSSVALDTGTLTFASVTAAVASGDNYLLFRDFPWSVWLRLLNDTVRSLHWEKHVYVQGITDMLKYSLPTPISSPSWLRDVHYGQFPFRWTDPQTPGIRWFRVDRTDVAGNLFVVLESALNASQQLHFLATPPYAHPNTSAYTMTSSVCTPFGETVGADIPKDWLVAGVVWRALVEKSRNLTQAARALWKDNLDQAARIYASKCQAYGVGLIGRELGWREPW